MEGVVVNHVRTLLLNLPQAGGFEYVPTTYTPPQLTQKLRNASRALFGTTGSRVQAEARVDRLLTYAHASTLAPDLVLNDPRITYDPASPVAAGTETADPDPHAFAAAASRTDLDDVFSPGVSAAEARWFDVWTGNDPAPLRAVALALALAARTAELVGT